MRFHQLVNELTQVHGFDRKHAVLGTRCILGLDNKFTLKDMAYYFRSHTHKLISEHDYHRIMEAAQVASQIN